MSTSKEFVLYNYFRSSASYRVRIALELKNIDYEYRAVHLVKNGGEQYSPEYAAINPSREVPTLVHQGHVVAQSIAILDYLDHVSPTPLLFPKSPHARALVLQACEIINSGSQPISNLRVLKLLGEKFGADEAQKEDWMKYWVRYGLETMEQFLKPHAGKFSIGDQPSAADCCLIPHLFNANRFNVSTAEFPTIERVRANATALDAFKKAAPQNQPDYPPDLPKT